MQKKVRSCLIAALILLFLTAIAVAGIIYRTAYAKTAVASSVSNDGRYSLHIYMIGEPEWPFGATHCRFDLFKDEKRIIKQPCSIQDDGAVAHAGNFNITWNANRVTIVVSGSEQADEEYILYFNGTVES